MPSFTKLFSEIFRLYVTDGVPASGAHEPIKTDIQAWGATVEGFIDTILDANLTIYVRDDATGNTNRDGSVDSVASAFLTWQAAIDWADDNINTNGFALVFTQGTTGASFPHTYTAGSGVPIIALTTAPRGGGTRNFVFHPTTAANVVLQTAGAASSFDLGGDYGTINVSGNVTITGPDHGGILNQGRGIFNNNGTIRFLECAGACIQNSQDGAYFNNSNGAELIFEGDANAAIRVDSGTLHINGDITFVGVPEFATAFWIGDFFSQGYLNGPAMTGTFEGRRFVMKDRSVVRYLAAAPPPGDSRGLAEPNTTVSQDGLTENVVVGTATFVASTTVAVDFSTQAKPDQFNGTNGTVYLVEISGGNAARTYAVHPADRLTTGFTITASASNSDTVHWRLEWLAP